MKIKINYDLMEKIDNSKNGLKLSRELKKYHTSKPMLCLHTFDLIYVISLLGRKRFLSVFIYITIRGIAEIFNALLTKLRINNMKEFEILFSNIELTELLVQLSSINVTTSLEKLQEAEVLETNYKFKFIDSKPILTQKKYINIPLTNGYEECILQEHNIGYSDYEISKEEPEKKIVLKTVRSSI